jgi:hypothetical protein
MISSKASGAARVAVHLDHRVEVVAVDGVVDRVVGDVVGHAVLSGGPGGDQRLGGDGGVQGRVGAALGDALAQPRLDAREELVRHFLGDRAGLVPAAEDDPHQVAPLAGEGDQLGHARPQLRLEVRACGPVRRVHPRPQLAERAEGDLAEQRLLVREVQVEGPGGDARGASDLGRGRAAQALAGEQLGGGGHQPAARLRPVSGGGRIRLDADLEAGGAGGGGGRVGADAHFTH